MSIACLRGASKLRGISMYKYIAELASTEPQVPLPVCTALSRCVGDPADKIYQSLSLYPITASTYLQAVETLLQGVEKINTSLFTPTQAAPPETPKQAPPPPAAQKKGAPAPTAPAASSTPVQHHTLPLTIPLNGCACLLKQSVDGAIKV